MSRPLDWISLGSLAALAALLALAVSLSACDEEQAITLRPVELVDPAPADPFETDPLLAPPALDCEDCALRRVELPGGDVVTVRGDSKATLRLAPAVVSSIERAVERGPAGPVAADEAADARAAVGDGSAGVPGASGIERYAVYAVLDEAGSEAWRRFAVAHARQLVLVEIGGRPVDLVRPLGWSRGLRIGVFADEAAREAFVRALPFGKRSFGKRPFGKRP